MTHPVTELRRARTPKTNPETRKITGFPGLSPDPRSTNPAAKPQVRGTLPGFRVSGFGFGLPAHARTRDPPPASLVQPVQPRVIPLKEPHPMSTAPTHHSCDDKVQEVH